MIDPLSASNMSWLLSGQLQSSLGSLKNQVASSLKEVFEAVDEDGDDAELDDPNQDPSEKVELAKSRIRELKNLLENKSSDVEKLKKQNESLLHLKKVCDVIGANWYLNEPRLSHHSRHLGTIIRIQCLILCPVILHK